MNSKVRGKVYSTVALVGSALVVWGVISADELAQLKDSLPELVAVVTAVLARANLSDD